MFVWREVDNVQKPHLLIGITESVYVVNINIDLDHNEITIPYSSSDYYYDEYYQYSWLELKEDTKIIMPSDEYVTIFDYQHEEFVYSLCKLVFDIYLIYKLKQCYKRFW